MEQATISQVEISEKLKRLLDKWNVEKELFKLETERYSAHVKALSSLNDMINKQALDEGLSLSQITR